MKRLLLEGGAQRSLFTAGVLDKFMQANIYFDEVYGISAGALSAVSYKSGDLGRNYKQMQQFTDDEKYISIKNWVKTGNAFNWNYLFHTIPERYLPFHYARFKNSPMKLFAGAYQVETGKSVYFPITDFDNPKDLLYLQATASLPVFTKLCPIDGKLYADGGVNDSFALKAFKDDGAKTVLVTTRDITYHKKEDEKNLPYLQVLYKDYPLLIKDYSNRAAGYNKDLEEITKLEKAGKLFVIRPAKPVTVSRVEKDKKKLEDLYNEGIQVTKDKLAELKEYLENLKNNKKLLN